MRANRWIPAPHREVSTTLAAAMPGALGATAGTGVNLGSDLLGGSFAFDPFSAYREGRVTNPNVVVLGQIGRGKSTFVKTLLLRELERGRRAVVLDPKGEYGGLAAAVGVRPVVVAPSGTTRCNPLLPGHDREAVRRDVGVIALLVAHGLGRNLTPIERTALDVARSSCTTPVTLDAVAAALLAPTTAAADELKLDVPTLLTNGREVAYELLRFTRGDLAGMLSGESTPDVDFSAPLVVIDCSAIWGTEALAPVMAAIIARVHQIGETDPTPRYFVLDEAWAVLSDPRIARWLQGSWKLARATATANICVLHRVADCVSAGAAGSVEQHLAAGLLADSGTVVCFSLDPTDAADAARTVGLSAPAGRLLPKLRRGLAVIRVGHEHHLVAIEIDAAAAEVSESDTAMWR